MFGILGNIAEIAAKTVVALPVAVVADVVTIGGVLTDKPEGTYTGNIVNSICKNIENIND